MKFRYLLLTVLLAMTALVVLPAAAQTPTTATVGYNGFSFTYDTTVASHVDIDPYAGDPPDAAGMAEVKHVQFTISDSDTAPSLFDAAIGIRVYTTADFAMYQAYQQQMMAAYMQMQQQAAAQQQQLLQQQAQQRK